MMRSVFGASAAALLVVAASGCVDEKKVFVERPFFEQPAANAGGFVGYTDSTTKQTACGNCHVSHQADWKETAHSHAWADLKASDHAAASCEACHTISQLGNSAASANVGYTSTQDLRYKDVQCESCHGAGLDHAQNPESASKPLASIAADTGKLSAGTCAACHNGSHHPFVEEWRASLHGVADSHAVTSTSTTGKCVNCHGAQAWLERMGMTANYKEKGRTGAAMAGITCAVCHDAHSDRNPAQTRLSVSAADTTKNLCMTCHMRRSVPELASSSGAHAPEGPTLLGQSGYIPPGATFKYGDLKGTHTTGAMCVTCHMSTKSFTTDTKGNSNIGHTFQATPCVDAAGKFVGGTCEDAQRSFKACATGGCHGSEAAARSAYMTAELRLTTLATEANRLIALVPKAEFSTTDGVITVGEGAKFNVSIGTAAGAAAHNPFHVEALLTSSIQALKNQYKLTSTPGLNLSNTFQHTAR